MLQRSGADERGKPATAAAESATAGTKPASAALCVRLLASRLQPASRAVCISEFEIAALSALEIAAISEFAIAALTEREKADFAVSGHCVVAALVLRRVLACAASPSTVSRL